MIHRFHLGDYYIVLDVCSGAVHAVDELAYEMIGLYEQAERESVLEAMRRRFPETSEEELIDCYAQIGELKSAGQLFTPDSFEPLAGKFKEKSGDVIKALWTCIGYTVLLCFTLFKTSSLSKTILNAH